jgi:hypothetical protein
MLWKNWSETLGPFRQVAVFEVGQDHLDFAVGAVIAHGRFQLL